MPGLPKGPATPDDQEGERLREGVAVATVKYFVRDELP